MLFNPRSILIMQVYDQSYFIYDHSIFSKDISYRTILSNICFPLFLKPCRNDIKEIWLLFLTSQVNLWSFLDGPLQQVLYRSASLVKVGCVNGSYCLKGKREKGSEGINFTFLYEFSIFQIIDTNKITLMIVFL